MAISPGKKVVGYAWTGTYRSRSEHRLGWLMPYSLAHGHSGSLTSDQKKALGRIPSRQFAHADMWRVKITIEAVKDKRGKFIVKRYGKPKKVKP
jgi:hypothetical protein